MCKMRPAYLQDEYDFFIWFSEITDLHNSIAQVWSFERPQLGENMNFGLKNTQVSTIFGNFLILWFRLIDIINFDNIQIAQTYSDLSKFRKSMVKTPTFLKTYERLPLAVFLWHLVQ